jgi:hydrogenase-1 operon protein HyaF
MQPYEIPGAVIGPGSQPTEADGAELAYLPFPTGMQTYRPPELPEPDAAQTCLQGLRELDLLLAYLRGYRVLEPARSIDLRPLPDADRLLVTQALGEGEVSILFATDDRLRMQETRLAGVWRVQSRDDAGEVQRDEIAVADIPSEVRERAFNAAVSQILLDERLPEGVLTAQSLLAELNDQSPSWRVGDPPHVLNLTLLPLTNEDQTYLEQRLGPGPLTILSRGYGSCRIAATALRHCWWVQHFNSDGRLIVNTLEVVDVPAAALAAQEDIDDSAVRLVDILDALR